MATALRATFREIRRAAGRLDRHGAVTAINAPADEWSALSMEHVRRSLNLKAWLLPQPFSPEAEAFRASAAPHTWNRLVHFGACVRQQIEPSARYGRVLNSLR